MPITTESPDNALPTVASDGAQQTAPAYPHARWNVAVFTLDVACFSIAVSLIDVRAILPVLLQRLGASGLVIGALTGLWFLSFNVPQIVGAWLAHGARRNKPVLLLAACTTRLPLVALPLIIARAADSPVARTFALASLAIGLTIWGIGDGLGYVPWMEIVARSFSTRTRGRFFAVTQLLSGGVSLVAAVCIVRPVLSGARLPYPLNYALLVGLAAAMFQVSSIGILLVREPLPPVPARAISRPPLATYLRRLPGLLRSSPVFARLAAIQLLLGFGAASAPFYVIYAIHHFRLPDSWVATYQMMESAGLIGLMPLWTFLSERGSPAEAVRALGAACLLSPLLAVSVGLLSPWLFGLVFFFMGGSLTWGMWIVMNHFLLTHAGDHERPVMVALLNLLFTPSAIYPVLGGLLVHRGAPIGLFGVPALFVVTAAVVAAGCGLTIRLGKVD